MIFHNTKHSLPRRKKMLSVGRVDRTTHAIRWDVVTLDLQEEDGVSTAYWKTIIPNSEHYPSFAIEDDQIWVPRPQVRSRQVPYRCWTIDTGVGDYPSCTVITSSGYSLKFTGAIAHGRKIACEIRHVSTGELLWHLFPVHVEEFTRLIESNARFPFLHSDYCISQLENTTKTTNAIIAALRPYMLE